MLFWTCANRAIEKKGLKDVATFPIGTAIQTFKLLNDSQLQVLQQKNFNSITATSDMKMHQILPAESKHRQTVFPANLYD